MITLLILKVASSTPDKIFNSVDDFHNMAIPFYLNDKLITQI